VDVVGRVAELGRFPVKSMQGEAPERVAFGPSGMVGDRTHGLIDIESGKVASAKDPRAWGRLLEFRAVWVGDVVEITAPDGTVVRSDHADADDRLSAATGRRVQLSAGVPAGGTYDYVWEVDDIAPEEVVTGSQTGTTDEGRPVSTMPIAVLAPGTFQDVAPVTILTTAALATMAERHPDSDWSPVRFRSNLLLEVDGDGIVENDWIGCRIAIGDVELQITSPSPRCVMTTLPQLGLPRDRGILQAVARHNRLEFAGFGEWACLGVYTDVVIPGEIAVGDAVAVLPAS
jgi:uncharacterized protein